MFMPFGSMKTRVFLFLFDNQMDAIDSSSKLKVASFSLQHKI